MSNLPTILKRFSSKQIYASLGFVDPDAIDSLMDSVRDFFDMSKVTVHEKLIPVRLKDEDFEAASVDILAKFLFDCGYPVAEGSLLIAVKLLDSSIMKTLFQFEAAHNPPGPRPMSPHIYALVAVCGAMDTLTKGTAENHWRITTSRNPKSSSKSMVTMTLVASLTPHSEETMKFHDIFTKIYFAYGMGIWDRLPEAARNRLFLGTAGSRYLKMLFGLLHKIANLAAFPRLMSFQANHDPNFVYFNLHPEVGGHENATRVIRAAICTLLIARVVSLTDFLELYAKNSATYSKKVFHGMSEDNAMMNIESVFGKFTTPQFMDAAFPLAMTKVKIDSLGKFDGDFPDTSKLTGYVAATKNIKEFIDSRALKE